MIDTGMEREESNGSRRFKFAQSTLQLRNGPLSLTTVKRIALE